MSDTDVGDPLDTADAFAVLGNELRLRILEALWALDRPAAFSEVRRELGAVDSGKFTYHLQELTGPFVRRTDEGYDLHWAGVAVIQAARSGTYTGKRSRAPVPVAGPCPRCGGRVDLWYESGVVRVDCVNDHRLSQYPFPAGGFEGRTREAVARAYDRRTRRLVGLALDGVCWACNGPRRPVVREDVNLDWPVYVSLDCGRCQHDIGIPPGFALLDDPDVRLFYRENDEPLADRPHWTLPWCTGDAGTTVCSEDPRRIEVPVTLDDEVLRVTLDGDLSVVATARE